MSIIKEYTKDGLRLTHPSGAVQLLRIENLLTIKTLLENQVPKQKAAIAEINAHIEELKKCQK